MKSVERVSLWAVGVLIGIGASCRSVPPDLRPPPEVVAPEGLLLDATAYAGGCVEGPHPSLGPNDIEADPRRVLPLEVELWLTATGPATFETDPLAERTQVVLVNDEREALRAAPRLFGRSRLALGNAAEAGRAALAEAEPSEALLLFHGDELASAGMTYQLRASLMEAVEDPDNFLGEFPKRPPIEKAVEFAFECRDGKFAWLVGMSDAVTPEDPEAVTTPNEARYRPGGARPRHERLVPTVRPVAGSRGLIYLPSPFAAPDAQVRPLGLAVYFELGEAAGDEATPEVLAAMGTRLATALKRVGESQRNLARATLVRTIAKGGSVAETARETIARLGELVEAGVDPRSALVFLSGALETPLARELVLVLDRPALDVLTADLIAASKKNTAADPFDPSWSLEAAAWRALVAALSAGDERAPELRAAFGGIALVAAGQLGAFPTLIQDALRSSDSIESFGARLIAENRIFLEDSSPAARARAFAWLDRRGLAPRGFDPLSPRKERRAALEAANEQLEGSAE